MKILCKCLLSEVVTDVAAEKRATSKSPERNINRKSVSGPRDKQQQLQNSEGRKKFID